MNEQNLYNSLNLAENIKNITKTKGVVIGVMLSDLNLGSNTMSNISVYLSICFSVEMYNTARSPTRSENFSKRIAHTPKCTTQ